VSRLHAVMATVEQVAEHFGAAVAPNVMVHAEVTEGIPALVVFEKNGRRILRNMTWGFPRLTREMRKRGDPPGIIGLVADLTNPLWDRLVVDPRYRCLIVLTHFGNPDGDPGSKTRTWFSVEGQPIVAWAGFCRNTDEGPACAGMTMEANAAIPPTNDRMPVLLEPGEYDRWLRGSIRDVISFQFRPPIAAERMVIDRIEDLWRSDGLPTMQLSLL